MLDDYDSSASGYIADSFEGISREFTDVEVLSTSDVNVVAKGKRYGRWWLLKGLNKLVANEVAYQQRLRKELELLMQLQHPGVVTAVGIEEVKSLGLCIVMEYVDGVTLKEWLQGKHSRKECRRVAMELSETVGYVHSKGIVHRDLKPENIMVTRNGGNVKLIDFGLADSDSHAVLKQPAGTPKYMSPEQQQTAVPDVRNDIYSLGVIFSQMNLGYGFRPIVRKCKKPIDQRYQHIDSMMEAMRKGRPMWKLLMAGAIVILVLAFGVYLKTQMRSARLHVPQTEQPSDRQSPQRQTVDDAIRREKEQPSDRQSTQRQAVDDAVDDAIRRGKKVIDAAVRESGIAQHLDTLSSLAYLTPDFVKRMNGETEACNSYLASIKSQYAEADFTEIRDVLMQYLGNHQKEVVEKFNKMKQDYDRSVMQGY